MNSTINYIPIGPGPVKAEYALLTFKPGDNIKEEEVKKFAITVEKNITVVVAGIVENLTKEGYSPRVTIMNGITIVDVLRSPSAAVAYGDECFTALKDLQKQGALVNVNTTIAISANLADVPAVVSSLDQFFGNWYAVAGLAATAAVFTGVYWAMTVIRRPQPA